MADQFWRVKKDRNIYHLDIATVQQWLEDGRISPSDKVKKRGVGWVAINSVPELLPVEPSEVDNLPSRRAAAINPNFYRAEYWQAVAHAGCHNHPQFPPQYICPECCMTLCLDCANFVVNTRISVCPLCGALCREYLPVKKHVLSLMEQKSDFGLSDIKIAVRYPLEMYVAPIAIFSIMVAIGFSGLPLFIGFAILCYHTGNAIKDIMIGNRQGAAQIDFTSFLAEPFSSFLTGVGALFITFAPILLITIGKLAFLKFLLPVAICWAIFYYPLAILVAGKTDSFIDTINPILGFKIIQSLGKLYYKVFAYYFAFISPVLIFIALFPREYGIGSFLFLFGALFGAPFFYINMIIAGILARAMFKNAKKFGILTN